LHKKNRSRNDLTLQDHSPETVHLTIVLAIKLWREHGKEETEAMKRFSALPDPYKSGYRHSVALKATDGEGPITERHLQDVLNAPST
jgi:hypothetical protein